LSRDTEDNLQRSQNGAAPVAPRNWSNGKRRFWRFIRAQTNRLVILTGIVVFTVIYFWNSMFVTIQSGEVGVMFRRFAGGTVTDKLLFEGIRFVPPWDKLYVYNARLQEFHHSVTVLSVEGVAIKLDISVRWRPVMELIGLLHQRIGPDFEEKVVKPEVDAALRRTIGAHSVNDIYMKASDVGQRVLDESLEKTQRNYVQIDEVLVRSVELPPALQERITAKLMKRESILIAKAEKDRLAIEAGGVKAYNKILQESLKPEILQWQAIQATKALANSANAKTVVIGRNSDGLPIILPK
jgi:regulator of protease activity HflC (stomatin/prohibitin superfamily)